MLRPDGWMLVHEDKPDEPVGNGFLATDFRGDKATIIGGVPPHKPSSTGRVYTGSNGSHFPSVFGLKWVNTLDQ